MVCLCLAVGSPVRITLLHKLNTGLIVTHLSCAPSGLLCSWVEVVDKSWNPLASFGLGSRDYKIAETSARVVVADFATGRSREVAQLMSPAFQWQPLMPKDQHEAQRRPAQAQWAPDGLGLFLLDRTKGCNCSIVQQLMF